MTQVKRDKFAILGHETPRDRLMVKKLPKNWWGLNCVFPTLRRSRYISCRCNGPSLYLRGIRRTRVTGERTTTGLISEHTTWGIQDYRSAVLGRNPWQTSYLTETTGYTASLEDRKPSVFLQSLHHQEDTLTSPLSTNPKHQGWPPKKPKPKTNKNNQTCH